MARGNKKGKGKNQRKTTAQEFKGKEPIAKSVSDKTDDSSYKLLDLCQDFYASQHGPNKDEAFNRLKTEITNNKGISNKELFNVFTKGFVIEEKECLIGKSEKEINLYTSDRNTGPLGQIKLNDKDRESLKEYNMRIAKSPLNIHIVYYLCKPYEEFVNSIGFGYKCKNSPEIDIILAVMERCQNENFLGTKALKNLFVQMLSDNLVNSKDIIEKIVQNNKINLNMKLSDFETIDCVKDFTLFGYLFQVVFTSGICGYDNKVLIGMVNNPECDLNKEYSTSQFEGVGAITPLMLCVYTGNYEGVKILVEDARVDIHHSIRVGDKEVNALNFVGYDQEIIEFLLEKGINFTRAPFIEKSSRDSSSSQKYCARFVSRVLEKYKIKKALKELESISESPEAAEEGSTGKQLADNNIDDISSSSSSSEYVAGIEDNVEENLDDLLIKYFKNKSSGTEAKIRDLCQDYENSFKLISVLNKKYSDYNSEDLVGEVITNGKYIGNYYQQRKKDIDCKLKELESRSTVKETTQEWVVNGEKISESDVIKINTRNNSFDLYIKIPNGAKGRFGSAFDNVKFITKGSNGQNGIKIRNDKGLYVLKPDGGDQRLVADVLHKNEMGKSLVVFEKVMTHSDIDGWKKGNDLSNFKSRINFDDHGENEGDISSGEHFSGDNDVLDVLGDSESA